MGKKEEYEFATEYPTSEVSENEVLISFNNDSGAEKFHEWWGQAGEKLFDLFLADCAD